MKLMGIFQPKYQILGVGIGLDEGDGDETYVSGIMASANFRPTDGTILGGIEISNSLHTV
jgi:hypothetical protein